MNRAVFAGCEAKARAVLPLLGTGGVPSRDDAEDLAFAIEFLLRWLFHTRTETSPYWIDGVKLTALALATPSTVICDGWFWCADHRDQWEVPLQAELHFAEPGRDQMTSVCIKVGDASLATLKEHDGRSVHKKLKAWMCEFVVQRPAPIPRPDPESVLAELRAWTADNAAGQIVGPDWEPLTENQAEAFIRSQAAQGCSITLKATWLDGGPAISLLPTRPADPYCSD